VFTARYALRPYIKEKLFFLKGLNTCMLKIIDLIEPLIFRFA
jgi:hypothetical protein